MLKITQRYTLCCRINPHNKKTEYVVCDTLETAKKLYPQINGWKWQYVSLVIDDNSDEVKKIVG